MNFSKTIIRWYYQNKRDLPWRHTRDPYKIWLSEIILQQTRVAQGLPYYEKFVLQFPTVHHLAKAKEDVVMRAWQGLGYYSRARNLHSSAKFVSKELKGEFPQTFHEIKKLKGIGDYTAAAIASFAFNEPHAVVDGNVYRVLSRYLGARIPIDSIAGKKFFSAKADALIDKRDPGTFNQALMEFGARQCVPQNPDCRICPLKKGCTAYAKGLVDVLPVKSQKLTVKKRYFNYLVFRQKDKILIRKRTENDIWKNLYDFPVMESSKKISDKEFKKMCTRLKARTLSSSRTFKHILSHQVLFAKFWEMSSSKILPGSLRGVIPVNSIYIPKNQIDKYAFSRLVERYFEENTL